MAVLTPTQSRTIDPYAEERWSSVINRMTRLVTAGNDVIIKPEQSFRITIDDEATITIQPGLFVKDDCLIHITEDYTVDFNDMTNELYVDAVGGMDTTGYYFVVAQYSYARTLPPQKAYYRLIKDKATYDTYTGRFIYLASIKVIDDSGYKIDTTVNPYYYHPDYPTTILRPTVGSLLVVDGGDI